MAECPGGRTTRSTRSQFRLGLSGLGQCKGFYPIPYGDIMDVGPSSPTGILSRDLISPTKGTRTRTVREYEETISELKKENFDLKLKQYMFDEAQKKKFQKDGHSADTETIEVIVKLQFLENELKDKDKLLKDALEKVEKYEVDFKEIENKYNDLQAQLYAYSELPAKEEYLSLLDEKKHLIKHTEFLENALTEKEEDLNNVNQKLEILAEENEKLEEKIKKRSKALEGFILKHAKEKDMLPDELKNIVKSATQAAKDGRKDDLVIAIKNISSTLNQMMSLSNKYKNDENADNSKCLNKEFLETSGSPLSKEKELRLSHIQASEQLSVYTQTDIVGCNLLKDYEIMKLQNNEELSDNVEELRKDILLLLLVIEDRNNELTEVKQSLLDVKEDFKKALNTTYMLDKDYFMNERNELHERLALSCAVNEDLLRHLKNLESFMEDLLQKKFNDSNQTLSENSDFINSVSKCLNQSLKLSHDLSNHLSICEGSKLFEECESLSRSDNYTNNKSLLHFKLSGFNASESYSSSYQDPGTQVLDDYVPFVRKSDDRMNKEYGGSQLCWRCWQQLNTVLNNSEISYQIQNNISHKNVGYPSSESDIWSEPDRNISMQRIGISLQNSPVSSKSPRKLRLKEKRMSSRLSSNQDTSSNESTRLFKKRHGSVNRNLFSQSIQNEDLNEKNVELGKNLDDVKKMLNNKREALESVKEQNLKLSNQINHFKKELSNMKEEKTELFKTNKKLSEELTISKRNNYELGLKNFELEEKIKESNVALDQITAELHATKLDLENMSKKCLACENKLDQQICKKEEYKNKLKALESTSLNEKQKVDQLNAENNRCVTELETFMTKNHTLEKENEILNNNLKSNENKLLSLQDSIKNLQADREDLHVKCTELKNELDKKMKESSIGLDHLTSELQKKNLDIVSKSKKCLEFENELDQQICKKKECECKLKALENISLNEKKRYLSQINELNAEKNHCVMELEIVQQKILALELENEMLNDNLKSNNKEIVSLQTSIDKLQKDKETLNAKYEEIQIELEEWKESKGALDQLNSELQRNKLTLENMSKKCLDFENELDQQSSKKEECENKLKALENTSLIEKKKYLKQINELSAERNHYKMELKTIQENKIALEKENDILNKNLKSNNKEIVSLQSSIDDLQKDKETLSAKCEELHIELEKWKESSGALDQLNSELQRNKLASENMSNKCLDHCLMELKAIQENKIALEKENDILNKNLESNNNEIVSLQTSIDDLQKDKETLSAQCSELEMKLRNAQQHMEHFQNKCYENEEKSLNEKQYLVNKISLLTKEREDILHKLKNEKECYQRLIAEKNELNQNYVESCQQISSLKLLNGELKDQEENLLKKNNLFEKELHSSTSECNSLSQDLKCLRETLQNLESKCLVYEKELVAASGMKENFVECLLNINNEFSSQRQKVNEICKVYANEDYVLGNDETSKFIPVIDEDNIGQLCEKLISESKSLMQSVDILLELLKNVHLKNIKTKTSEEKNRTSSIDLKQMESHKAEIGHLKSTNDNLKRVIDELQESVSDKEKSVQFSALEIQSLKEKNCDYEKEIEKVNQLLNRKEDEITMLQERIFNLQTQLHTILTEKLDLQDKNTSFDQKSLDGLENSASSNNQLPSQTCLKTPKMCQSEEFEVSSQNADDTVTSISSLEISKNSCCKKYWKKCCSLQTKLTFSEKHIEKLEKDKDDLRKDLLQHLQRKQNSSSEVDSIYTKVIELESKLEQKKSFINELKSELLKTCNSLIDKENELDDVKQKLSKNETKYKDAISDMHDRHSISTNSVDNNIKSLKNYKWGLIQTIFDIQKKFYEKKGIHLNYFEKFKDHVNNLYSMQLTQSFSKSESMPILGSHDVTLQYDQNGKVKNILGLELDIECLENLKIFLDRFFVPSILQTDVKSEKFEEKGKGISSDRLTLQTDIEKLKSSKLQQINILNTSFLDNFNTHLSLDYKDSSQEKSFSFENFASYVSHHLECIQKFLTAVTTVNKFQCLENFDISAKECADKAEVKSLLLKIFQEIKVLMENSDKLFHLNSLLKNFDFVATPILINSKKQDLSDRESLMSEETIAVSRSESPFSFEEFFPTKLSCTEMSKLEEKPKSLENRVAVTDPFATKVDNKTTGSSCDSVCHRSHFSSPDLGIESDPNHDSSAPEQKDDGLNKYQRLITEERKTTAKTQQKTIFTSTESAGRWSGYKFGETLYAIGNLPDFELLKKEVKESLVAIKSVLSRTGDGLHHIAKYTSPRKTLEYNTLKSIKDTCAHLEVCLKASHELVAKFWTAPCPSEREWKFLIDENQNLSNQLANLKASIQRQENEFNRAIGKLEQAEVVKASLEKKISKKLVKTKKVIRQAELKLLENGCQNFLPVPKFPSDQTEQLSEDV